MNSLNCGCQEIKTLYSLVKHLKLHSESDEKYKNLYASWIQDEKVYASALLAIANNFPHYSMHDASHSWNIINKIEMLLGEARIKQLSPTDTFLILETAFIHDLGMIISEDEQEQLWKSIKFKKFIEDIINDNYDTDLVVAAKFIKDMEKNGVPKHKIKTWPIDVKRFVVLLNAEYFRRIHNYRSAEVIVNSKQVDVLNNRNNLIPERIMRLIAQISIMHGTDFNDVLTKLCKEDNGVGIDIIHPRMIACLLRLGDLLDLDNGRFNETLGKIISMPEISLDHKDKHQAITHFLVSPEKIEVSAICPNDRVYRATRQWFDWLQDELKNLSSKWSDIVPYNFIGGPPSLGDIKLSIKEDKGITEQLNFRFNIDQKVAFEFIEGEGIYINKLDCIREVIQNALDATKIQMWRDIKSKKYDLLYECTNISEKELNFSIDIPKVIRQLYPISINLNEVKDNNESVFEISIEDRGCGISLSDLKRMESVGKSWSTNIEKYSEIEEMKEWFKPTGSFGIGLHSLFMITDEVTIETKSENGDAYNITFISSKNNGYISVKVVSEKRTIGTKVKFKFRTNIVEQAYLHSLSPEITELMEKSTNEYDIVDFEYRNYMNKNKICCILNGYLNSVTWIPFVRLGELEKYKEVKSNFLKIYEKDLKEDNDLRIAISYDTDLEQLVALVHDMSNLTQIYFTLENNKKYLASFYESFIVEALGLGRFMNIWNGVDIYYKDIFCTNKSCTLFNIKINIVSGEAKKILNVNRSSFRNCDFINNYLKRIDNYINSRVIYHMWNYVYDNNKQCFNIEGANRIISVVLAGMYYKRYFDKDLDLNVFKDNKDFNQKVSCIKKNIGNQEDENASIMDVVNAERVFLLRAYNGINKEIAKKYNIDIIITNIRLDRIDRLKESIGFLTYNKIEYISSDKFIAYRDYEQTDSQIISLDYEKLEVVKEFLEQLYDKNNLSGSYRKKIYAFEYKNKNNIEKSKIKYLITDKYQIISPFIRNIDPCILENDIDKLIEELKKKCKFDELIDYVYKIALNKKSLTDKNYKEIIESAYKELISDYCKFILCNKSTIGK